MTRPPSLQIVPVLIALSLLLLLFGCTATQPGKASSSESCELTRTFHVVNHGWHTGIVVATHDLIRQLPELGKDFSGDDFIELGWGDEGFYRAPQAGVAQALSAVSWSGGSVLHLVQVPGEPGGYFPSGSVVALAVSQDGYQRLLAHLAASFARNPEGAVQMLGPGLYGSSRFYQARGRYSLFNNCNTWVAESVAISGVPMSSTPVLTAKGVMSQVQQASEVSGACGLEKPTDTH
ncbi:DUF2459 domain-containing protein [Metapseudomonas boanensis]|uniref:DUF2459 domain-containing protein n=1 Tax=Metapseudomonas boanensis TaxID=2822138 RepID=A0ABS5XL97_9GAMM|nr:DUF2459 domain-containing protein [Pseudomonas boanensis]